jgi:hypothetical protein
MHQNKSKKTILDSIHPLWLVLLVQFSALLLVKFSATAWVDWLIGLSYVQGFLLLQVGLAVLLSWLMGLPRWWLWVQAILPMGLYWGATQTFVDPLWFASLALLLMLVFSAVLKDRVPLYLTNTTTHQALVELVQTYQVRSVLDLGSGLGGVVRALARAGIDAKGVEYSPMLALVSNRWCQWLGQGAVSQGDMWQTDLSQVDMVYVFLSPVPMTRLWQKACAEMKSGALLVSNSFAIEGVEPLEVWELSDGRQTQLLIYQIP